MVLQKHDLIGIGPRKNPNWGVDGIMEFLPGGKSMWKFQGSVKKELEFPVVFKKNSCGMWNLHGSWFLTLEFANLSGASNTILQNF